MNKIRISVKIMLLLLVLIPAIAKCQAPTNPLPVYRHHGPHKSDSTLIGQVYFDPLPNYRTESRLIIEYYSQIDTKRGIDFLDDAGWNTLIRLDAYGKTAPGPIAVGDTVRCEFIIEPLQVGIIPLRFIFGETPPPGDHPLRLLNICGGIDAKLLLNPDGTAQNIGDKYVDYRNTTRLGPNRDLFKKGISFSYTPKAPQDYAEQNKSYRDFVSKRVERYFFSVNSELKVGGDGGDIIEIVSRVSSYHYFEAGIVPAIHCNDNFSVFEISPSLARAVDSNLVYEFTAKVRVVKPGIGLLVLSFSTPNPDRYDKDGIFSDLGPVDLNSGISLYIGIDENRKIDFITEEYPWKNLETLREKGFRDPNAIDSRYRSLDNRVLDWKTTSHYGEGHRIVDNYWHIKSKEDK